MWPIYILKSGILPKLYTYSNLTKITACVRRKILKQYGAIKWKLGSKERIKWNPDR